MHLLLALAASDFRLPVAPAALAHLRLLPGHYLRLKLNRLNVELAKVLLGGFLVHPDGFHLVL